MLENTGNCWYTESHLHRRRIRIARPSNDRPEALQVVAHGRIDGRMPQGHGNVLDGGSMLQRDRSPRVAQACHRHVGQAESLAERSEPAGHGIRVEQA